MKSKTFSGILIIVILFIWLSNPLSGCKRNDNNVIRIGFFPNLTHAQAIYGYANGDFEKAFNNELNIKWIPFNSGPSEIEAIFAGAVDIGFIGPVPAINGFVKSMGDVKIIAGATLNGALFISREDIKIEELKNLKEMVIAIPQYGNTQHLCLLNILSFYGLKTIEKGGNIKIIESSNPDIKILMDKGYIDAALVPEPWATRLVEELDAKIILNNDEIWNSGDYSSAVIIVNKDFYEKKTHLVKTFLSTHIDITETINNDIDSSMKIINNKINELTGSKLDDNILCVAFNNLRVTYDPKISSIDEFINIYQNAGFIKGIKNKDNLYDFNILNSILKEKNLQEVL